jgi:hypothetical protein
VALSYSDIDNISHDIVGQGLLVKSLVDERRRSNDGGTGQGDDSGGTHIESCFRTGELFIDSGLRGLFFVVVVLLFCFVLFFSFPRVDFLRGLAALLCRVLILSKNRGRARAGGWGKRKTGADGLQTKLLTIMKECNCRRTTR